MYITTYHNPTTQTQTQMSYLDMLKGNISSENEPITEQTASKVTYKIGIPKPLEQLSSKQKTQIRSISWEIDAIFQQIYNKYIGIDLSSLYYEFKIPKASGGLRTINAPNADFKEDLNKIKDLFERHIKCLPHNSAYAYVKTRCTKEELQKHTENNSKWFLKIDLKDFFPSCSLELIMQKLRNLYPFYYLSNNIMDKLECLLSLCILNNGLPQGTPTSPFLTNLVMVEYDYKITEYLKSLGAGYVYTRYADDILISNKGKFNFNEILTKLNEILQPFTIKTEKTRFGSSNGRNWNLGLMVNKDNNITLGYRKKQLLNAMLNNFLRDASNNQYWNREDTYHLQGQLSYLKHIEPNYYNYIILKYETKYNKTVSSTISRILNPSV